ncbi:hypothetical protein J2S07_000165 [Robertmurraya andreesenii]|uniref:Uncharacterized protein n=1 Tax=Anoxybacillus andreesenii TaxID=1325932 RepID=A0ABT9UYV6_9BACL|nr:hypothetical protein [Robertmurraya andreesenii]
MLFSPTGLLLYKKDKDTRKRKGKIVNELFKKLNRIVIFVM